jgi:hypothetical protein
VQNFISQGFRGFGLCINFSEHWICRTEKFESPPRIKKSE